MVYKMEYSITQLATTLLFRFVRTLFTVPVLLPPRWLWELWSGSRIPPS